MLGRCGYSLGRCRISRRGVGLKEDAGEMWIQSWGGVRYEGRCWGDVDTDSGGVRFLGEVGLVWERYTVLERWRMLGRWGYSLREV